MKSHKLSLLFFLSNPTWWVIHYDVIRTEVIPRNVGGFHEFRQNFELQRIVTSLKQRVKVHNKTNTGWSGAGYGRIPIREINIGRGGSRVQYFFDDRYSGHIQLLIIQYLFYYAPLPSIWVTSQFLEVSNFVAGNFFCSDDVIFLRIIHHERKNQERQLIVSSFHSIYSVSIVLHTWYVLTDMVHFFLWFGTQHRYLFQIILKW